MIHVNLQPEPADFDARVRQPGLSALEAGVKKLPPYWRECIPALRERYRNICAYLCIFIPPVIGTATVDHLVPKSKRRDLAYEWNNYRLACQNMNSRKGAFEDVLDPVEIIDGWFVLDLTFMQVLPSPDLDARTRARVQATIDRLKLNDEECRVARYQWLECYWDEEIKFKRLEEMSPFVARELRRQGFIRQTPIQQ